MRGWEDHWEERFICVGHSERPWALYEHRDEMDHRSYWKAVAQAWSDSERTDFMLWADLLSAQRPGREQMMSDDERAELASLPDRVTVWRGVNEFNRIAGISWTLDREKAFWFARRWMDPDHEGPDPMEHHRCVIEGRVLRSRMMALFDNRNEREVIVFPRYVYDRKSLRP